MKRKIMRFIITVLIFLIALFLLIHNGYRFTEYSAIKAVNSNNLRITSEVQGNNEKYILFDDNKLDVFYDALVEKRLFGLLWKCTRYNSYVNYSEEPFVMTGLINYGTSKYYIGLKINDTKIKYISIGSDNTNSNPNEEYTLSLNDVKLHPDIYQYSEIGSNKYLSFSGNNYESIKFVIRAFDKDGKVYADKFRGTKIRFFN